MLELVTLISWEELKHSIKNLSNSKSPGLNDVPTDAFKALDDQNLLTLMKLFNSYWLEESYFTECHEGQLVQVSKSRDLSNPNKWREVILMEIGSKIFSIILCTRLFKIIRRHGVKYQLGLRPGVGCQDGSFAIKTMLHLQFNHNLPTFVIFSDILKDFDTSNHKLMVEILKKYGCPPELCSAIRRIYTNNNLKLIIVKIDISIPSKVGVKQGDSVAPVLFLFVIMEFTETIEKEWVRNYLKMIKFKQHSNSSQFSAESPANLQIHSPM